MEVFSAASGKTPGNSQTCTPFPESVKLTKGDHEASYSIFSIPFEAAKSGTPHDVVPRCGAKELTVLFSESYVQGVALGAMGHR